jgi:hypothetical protein
MMKQVLALMPARQDNRLYRSAFDNGIREVSGRPKPEPVVLQNQAAIAGFTPLFAVSMSATTSGFRLTC